MPKKKSFSYLSYLPVITLAVGLIVSWAKFSVQAENTKTKVDKVDEKVEKLADEGSKEIDELKKEDGKLEKAVEVNKAQQDNIQREVQQIADKTDKILTLIMESQRKK